MRQKTGRSADTQLLPFLFPSAAREMHCALISSSCLKTTTTTCFCLFGLIMSGRWQIQSEDSSAASYLWLDAPQCTMTVTLDLLLSSLTSPSVRLVDTHLCLFRLTGWCGGAQREPLVFKGHTWSECCLPSPSVWRSPMGERRVVMSTESCALNTEELYWEHLHSHVHQWR